ncbi:unnamed protein product [Adineta ricciae]|uniref:G-protein coupled receptors family 1 profile domain-containing protein n=1 Tax=Adineta ricciae TaxID=249248 RepID=A0A813R2C4_ADIRI|nr:unnamed protein product [Adineta ricciae]
MSTVDYLNFISQQVHIYFGLTILILGVIGDILNVIIFTTLKTFRETACAFYLTTVSLVNVCQLLIGLVIRILSDGFNMDIRKRSSVCKIHIFVIVWCLLTSISGLCLATIDQCVSMTRYRRFSNLPAARRNVLIICTVWSLYSIWFNRYWDVSSGDCTIINSNIIIYATRFHFPILIGCLPISIMVTFSLLAYYHARSYIRQPINIIYLSRDRQLTAMTLIHVLLFIITTLPYVIFYIYSWYRTGQDPTQVALHNLLYAIIILIDFVVYGGSFYLYCCVSERFRKQFIYVVAKLCINPCQQWTHTQVVPRVEVLLDGHHARTRTIHEAISMPCRTV